jgi:Uncharacterised protein family (UPF0175)
MLLHFRNDLRDMFVGQSFENRHMGIRHRNFSSFFRLFYCLSLKRGKRGWLEAACYHWKVKTDMSVRITIEIPDDIAAQIAAKGLELSRTALEALALEEFRGGTLTQYQVGHLLGLTRMETEDFLGKHADLYDFDPNELRREAEFLAKLPDSNQPQ